MQQIFVTIAVQAVSAAVVALLTALANRFATRYLAVSVPGVENAVQP